MYIMYIYIGGVISLPIYFYQLLPLKVGHEQMDSFLARPSGRWGPLPRQGQIIHDVGPFGGVDKGIVVYDLPQHLQVDDWRKLRSLKRHSGVCMHKSNI